MGTPYEGLFGCGNRFVPNGALGNSAPHQGCPASFSHVARTFGVNRPLEADPVSGNSVCKEAIVVLGRPGNDLLSRVLRHSTIGAEAFNGRVRDGIGFGRLAQVTGPAKDRLASMVFLFDGPCGHGP
jgi:hypothetical protein